MDTKENITIVEPLNEPLVDFGGREIEHALHRSGHRVSRRSALRAPDSGHVIVLTAPNMMPLHGLFDPNDNPQSAESYSVRVRREKERLVLGAIGKDARGTMYAALDLAEQISQSGTVTSIKPKDCCQSLPWRGIKVNIPLEGGNSRPTPQEEAAGHKWFFDLRFWERFADMLARNRYNALTLWLGHPFPFMVSVDKYPEATDLTREQLDHNIGFFKAIFGVLAARGVAVYIVTWNIHVSSAFARSHCLDPMARNESSLVQDYIKECVKALIATYPTIGGIGTCAGERMRPVGEPGAWNEDNIRWNAAWIRQTYGGAIAEAGRPLPFLLRSWFQRPTIVREELAGRIPGKLYIELKYNGEQMYSLPKPHVFDPAWVEGAGYGYDLLWHLRNDGIHLLRWGDPQFVRETVRSCMETGAAGYFWGGEEGRFGREGNHLWTGIVGSTVDGHAFHSEQARAHVCWDYEFEKHWYTYQLWGRLAFEPELPDTYWEGVFAQRFGDGIGPCLFRAMVAASTILPAVTAFHWNYMNHDWDPEICDGTGNTGLNLRQSIGPPFSRASKPLGHNFHTVLEFIFNHTLDAQWINIPNYVKAAVEGNAYTADVVTPVKVADALERAAKTISVEIPGASKGGPEQECLVLDLEALCALGHYYAQKIRGATELMFFLRTGQPSHHAVAVGHLEAAAAWWERLAVVAGDHYAHTTHDWRRHLEAARYDIELARATCPPPPQVR